MENLSFFYFVDSTDACISMQSLSTLTLLKSISSSDLPDECYIFHLFNSFLFIMWLLSCRHSVVFEIWGSHVDEDVGGGLLCSNTIWTCRQIPKFQRSLLPQSLGQDWGCIFIQNFSSTYESTHYFYPEDQISAQKPAVLTEVFNIFPSFSRHMLG